MTRGRKKDATIPPTRTLTLQRDYRARKAQYVADLEARCKAAEDENVRLRKELELARQGVSPSALTPEAIQASAHLRNILTAASASLSHFMQVALPSSHGTHATPPSYMPLLGPLSSAALAQSRTEETLNHNAASADCRTDPARPESPCCGGYIDCDGLVEDDEYSYDDGHQLSAISQLRTTSGTPKPFA
ncbi:hypothetical protein B0H17DRAFT_1198628 [Mycena rosella]|uniref:BZIP domain-containing protein n=1 Tax=Mycena rosella TaxID=1033263 RepID=A0AAD7DN34_MYCRO|nr:hypothetical protein B0H17DRAFT_1198628 [Mycena rosella]